MVLKQLSEDILLKRLETKNNLMRNCKKHVSNVTLWGKINRFAWSDIDVIKSFKDDPEEINEDNLYVVFGVSRWPYISTQRSARKKGN